MRVHGGFPVPQSPVATPGTVAIGAVAANTTATDTVAVAGARVGDFVVVRPNAALEAGLGIVGAYCAAANVVTIVLMNTTAGPLPAAAFTYDVMVLPTS